MVDMALFPTPQGLRYHAAQPTGHTNIVRCAAVHGPSHQDDALWYGQGSRLGLRFDAKRFELRSKTFSALALLLSPLALLLSPLAFLLSLLAFSFCPLAFLLY